MTQERTNTRKRSRPGLTGAERQAKHRRTHNVHMIALRQPAVDLLRGLRQHTGRSNYELMLEALQDLLTKHGMRAAANANGTLSVSPTAKGSRRKRSTKAAVPPKGVGGLNPANTKPMTDDGAAIERPLVERASPRSKRNHAIAGQDDLFC